MKKNREVIAQIVGVLGLFLLFSCAHPASPRTGNFSDRDPASFRAAAQPCELDPIRENLPSYLRSLFQLGVVKRSVVSRTLRGTSNDMAAKFVGSLPKLYLETEVLKRSFDQKIKQGKTVQDLMKPKQGYAKLLAARVLWEELNHSVQSYTRDRLMVAKRAAIASPDDSSDILVRESQSIEKFFSNSVLRTTDDVSLSLLALSDVDAYRKEATRFLMTCDSDSDAVGSGAQADQILVANARDFAKRPINRAVLKEKNFPFTALNVDQVFSVLAGKIQRTSQDEAPRPLDEDPLLIYKPDSGSAGNVRGDLFPKNVWALTYDDGPGGKTTPGILDNLNALKTKATFFALTQQVERFPDLLARELKDGHALASHSYSHARFPDLNDAELKKELDDAVSTLEAKSGTKVRFFRLPYGAGVSVKKIRDRIAGLGLIHVFWNVDTLDWQDKNPDTIYERALTQMKTLGRGVILFHDIHPQSVIASQRVLQYILNPENGLRHVTIPEIVEEQNKAVPAR